MKLLGSSPSFIKGRILGRQTTAHFCSYASHFAMEFFFFFLLFIALPVHAISERHHSYKIIHLDEPFQHRTLWKGFTYPDSGILWHYGTLRLDGVAAKWSLSNDTLVNKEILKIYNDSSIRCPIFNPHQFLTMLQDKTMGILGDSIAIQMFDGLYNSLLQHATSVTMYNSTRSVVETHTKDVRAVHFAAYNATIYACFDSFLMFKTEEPCIRTYFNESNDILVFGIGAHFKPKHMDSHRTDHVSYNQSYALSQEALKTISAQSRKIVADMNPNVKVIWRLQSHVGIIDELNYLHNISAKHGDPERWSNASECAHWVPVYNDIIIKQALVNNDPVIDWYKLSKLYMHYFYHGKGIPIHIDSMHYYADGVPRGGALLLQDAVYDLFHQSSS